MMSPENAAKTNINVSQINAMSDEELDRLIAEDACPYEPEHLVGIPLGMFHCPVCGEMVVAGLPHVRKAAV